MLSYVYLLLISYTLSLTYENNGKYVFKVFIYTVARFKWFKDTLTSNFEGFLEIIV